MRDYWYYSIGLALVVALVALAGCSKPQAQNAPPPPPPVSVAPAAEKEIVETDEFPGRIEAVESVEVRARVNGYIQSVHFKPGSQVKKGDLLFVIDPRPFQAELARAEATLAEQATSRREYDDAAAKVRQLSA